MTSYDVCRAAGWALVPRGVASGCFASANILLKSFVEQKGALSTIERCTGASHFACAPAKILRYMRLRIMQICTCVGFSMCRANDISSCSARYWALGHADLRFASHVPQIVRIAYAEIEAQHLAE